MPAGSAKRPASCSSRARVCSVAFLPPNSPCPCHPPQNESCPAAKSQLSMQKGSGGPRDTAAHLDVTLLAFGLLGAGAAL